MKKKVLICLHDITPYHLSRIQKAESLLLEWGVSKINYFLVPNFHRKNTEISKKHTAMFESWIQDRQHAAYDWILHGLYHEEDDAAGISLSLKDKLRKKYLTAREGEFFSLGLAEIAAKLEKGLLIFKNMLDRKPETFVSPAWLFNKHLIPSLKEQNFKYTEDHRKIYMIKQNEEISAPAITWASRSPMRKSLSLVGCPILYRMWSRKSMIRIAVHPHDFDHPSIIKSIKIIVMSALKNREPLLYKELDSIFQSD